MTMVVPVNFHFPGRLAPAARSVSLIGSFNGWNASVHPMRRAGTATGRSLYISRQGA
jgi:1,4-alpha-glucan branching enzyme